MSLDSQHIKRRKRRSKKPNVINLPSLKPEVIPTPEGFHLYIKMNTLSIWLEKEKFSYFKQHLNIIVNKYFKVVAESHYQFQPQGSSGSYVLSESHFNYHTYPENNLLIIDIYSCNMSIKPKDIMKDLCFVFTGQILEHSLHKRT